MRTLIVLLALLAAASVAAQDINQIHIAGTVAAEAAGEKMRIGFWIGSCTAATPRMTCTVGATAEQACTELRGQLVGGCDLDLDALVAAAGAAQRARDDAAAALETASHNLSLASERLGVVLWQMGHGRTEAQALRLQWHCEDTGAGEWDLRVTPPRGIDTDTSLFEVCPGLELTAP